MKSLSVEQCTLHHCSWVSAALQPGIICTTPCSGGFEQPLISIASPLDVTSEMSAFYYATQQGNYELASAAAAGAV